MRLVKARIKTQILPVLILLLVVSENLFVFAQQETAQAVWTPEQTMKVKSVGTVPGSGSAVRVSPDGRRVAYIVTSAVMTPDRSEYVSQIFTANADGTDIAQLTFHDKSSTDPQWSPDGRLLAFISNRSGKNNLYLLRMTGGEAEQITDVKTAVGSYSWSPDGRQIAFTMRDATTEDEEKLLKGKDDWRWVDENVKLSRLYVVAVAKDAAGRREPRRLTSADYNVNSFDWSPDAKSIVYAHTKFPKADYWTTSDVSVVDVASGQARTLAATSSAESQPLYSPDGKWIALSISDNPPRWAGSNALYLMPAQGGTPRAVAATYDAQPNLIGWSADAKRVYFSEAFGTATRIYALNVETNTVGEINRTTNEVYGGINLNRTGTMLGFVAQSSDRPPEAFVTRADNFAPVQVSRANADLPRLPLGRTELVRWKSADGMDIEGLLTYPANYQTGKRVPLILNIHGGPMGVFNQVFIASSRTPYPLAVFASRGYAVLRPNPRGSSGYGQTFRYANIKDWGGRDYEDLMKGVDKLVEIGVADPERLGVMGWSYGGYMTSWIITHTRRFKAASAGAPVTNLQSFTGTADIPSFIPDYFGGQPWENLDIYRAHSPISFVKGVTTPTLIQHGEADDRVPPSQGYELYNALRAQGVPTRMIVLPRQPHGPNEPKMILKAMLTNLEWFEKYLGESSRASNAQVKE
ncbi:MAG TPA: S9 family peptidase [Pyrinomonadaceae bacterium]